MSDQPQPPQFPPGISPLMAQRLFAGAPVPEIFANQIRMNVTLTDFTLIFGTGVSDPSSPRMGAGLGMVSDKIALHVAPGMLKYLLLHTQMAVEAYEAVMGPIKIPDKLPAFLDKHKAMLTEMLRQLMEGGLEQDKPPGSPS